VLTNSLTLITPTLDPLGIILDPTLGNINHSCDPNAFVMMDGASVSIRSLKPISKDEEVYISYIDATNPYHRRQSELKARWFFECHCTKCKKGATLAEDTWAKDPTNLPKKIQTIADTIIARGTVAQDPANYVGTSTSSLRAAAIQGKAFAEYEAAQSCPDPSEAVQVIEDAMRLCHQSGLFSPHRQPYAALRDDLIVNLLSVNNYPLAWAQCAKRYKYIHPTLFPIPFHPVRVVQTWQMGMLAAYLASTPDGGGAPGVNMGLIAMMLVKQVLDAAKLSHGEGSAFAKSVEEKAGEMVAEVVRSLGGSPERGVVEREIEGQRDLLGLMGEWVRD
jgi:hypothetical protein